MIGVAIRIVCSYQRQKTQQWLEKVRIYLTPNQGVVVQGWCCCVPMPARTEPSVQKFPPRGESGWGAVCQSTSALTVQCGLRTSS